MFHSLRNALSFLKTFIRLSAFCLHNTAPEPEAGFSFAKEKALKYFLKIAQHKTTWHTFCTDLF